MEFTGCPPTGPVPGWMYIKPIHALCENLHISLTGHGFKALCDFCGATRATEEQIRSFLAALRGPAREVL